MRRVLAILGLAGLTFLLFQIPDPDDRRIALTVYGILFAMFLILWVVEWASENRLSIGFFLSIPVYYWRKAVKWVRDYEQRNRLTEKEEAELRNSLDETLFI